MSGLTSRGERAWFTLLGPLAAYSDAGTIALGGTRARCVLAALLLNAGKVTSLDQLIDAAWGAVPPAGARVLVQNRVSALRRTLRLAGLATNLISTVGSGYVFRAERDLLDLDVFNRRLSRASELTGAGRAADAADEIAAALALWHGPALDGLSTPPLLAAAHQLEERRLRALERRITLDLELGRHAELVGELSGLIREHPYQEGFRGLLMLALHRSGRQAEALRVYRDTRANFTEQLGIEPGESLRLLHEAILRDDGRVGLATIIGEPGPGLAIAPVPRELPPDVAGFTGREDELGRLDALLAGEPGVPRVMITTIGGMAGVGKTALAVHWAHHNAHQFADGQLYVNLRGYDRGAPLPPIEALRQLLTALGQPADQIPAGVEQAAALYRSRLAGRRTLILLDNAHSAEQVRPLLPGSPGCLALITSRNRLAGLMARQGARRITLDVLAPEEARRLLERLVGIERVRAEPGASAELAALCAHLPLALHIAAANLANGRYACIADQVSELRDGDRLAALTTDRDEQAAVRGALDLSYREVPAQARRLFRLLGLVPGADVTAEAAAALAELDPAEAASALDRLAATHLIEEHAAGRFRFHELVRVYSAQRTRQEDSGDERAGAVHRLLDWYLRHAREAAMIIHADPRHHGPTGGDRGSVFAGPDPAARWLDDERGNLIAAVHHAVEHGPRGVAWLLGDTLGAAG